MKNDNGRDGARGHSSASWIVFFVTGLLIGLHAIYLIVLPTVDPQHWRAFTNDPEMLAYLADDFRASGAMQLGLAIMTMIVAARWYRAGDRWAWIAFWFFPFLFAWSMLTTWAVVLFLALTVLALAALVTSYRRFVPTRPPS